MSFSFKWTLLGYLFVSIILLGCSADQTKSGNFQKYYLIINDQVFSFNINKSFFLCVCYIDHEWHGEWFPKRPDEPDSVLNMTFNKIDDSSTNTNRMKWMGIQDPKCDDAMVIQNSFYIQFRNMKISFDSCYQSD